MSMPEHRREATARQAEDELPADIAGRARRLLGSLIRPILAGFVGLTTLTVTSTVARLVGPVFIALAIDQGLPKAIAGEPQQLVWQIAAFAGLGIASSLGFFFATRLNGVLSQRVMLDLRSRLFRHVQRLDLSYHERSTSGRLVSRQSSDMESVQEFVSTSFYETVLDLLQMLTIAVVLVFMDPLLAGVVFLGFIPMFFISRQAGRSQRNSYRRTRVFIARVIVHFVETMGGIRAVQAFRRQQAGNQTLASEDNQYRDANTRALQNVAYFAGSTRLVGNLTQTAIVLLGGVLVITGHTQVGVLTAFILYLRMFYGPLDELVQAFNLYQSASAALEKITAVLDTPAAVEEPRQPAQLPAVKAGVGRDVDFHQVRFAYDGSASAVLPTFDLHIPAGQIVALVGATGAGKSTLVKLLTRFYDPSAGAVCLDGVDIRSLADADLRAAVTMVTQESYLFSGSIADNIRIGKPSANDAEVKAAAHAVGLDTYVCKLPAGYDTDVKKRGGRLSSGQRQLVSFARVFLADPQVFVLDEATAHLDVPSERLVQNALATVLQGRTAVIIAHRLSTVEIADRVLVLSGGQIIEDGSPEELIAGSGNFASMYRAWQDSLA